MSSVVWTSSRGCFQSEAHEMTADHNCQVFFVLHTKD